MIGSTFDRPAGGGINMDFFRVRCRHPGLIGLLLAAVLWLTGNSACAGGRLIRCDDDSRSESYADILSRAGLAEIEGHGSAGGDPFAEKPYAMHAHGAVFAEVKVDPALGQVRATRLVGAFAAGTVINPRLVRSQYYGGMIWGVSFALYEAALLAGSALRAGHEREPGRVPHSSECRCAIARGHPDRRARPACERARH